MFVTNNIYAAIERFTINGVEILSLCSVGR